MTSNLTVKIGADVADLVNNLKKGTSALQSFQKNVSGMVGTLGAAFGIREVAAFTLEISRLAGEAEGVKAAFDRLPESEKLMRSLKKATGDTVSELDLMKRAVQASNFDIELAALPKLLQFATLRAQQTGQSVDYLVDSIVTGIGRKSKLILDNLGISAVALSEKLNGVSAEASTVGDVARAVGEIAEESLANMAKFSDNASTKIQKLSASWTNFKVILGNAANGTGALSNSIGFLSNAMDVLASDNLTFFQKWVGWLGGPATLQATKNLSDLRAKMDEIQKSKEAMQAQDIDPVTGLPMSGGTPWVAKKEEQLGLLEQVRQKITQVTDAREKATTINDVDKYTAQLKKLNGELDKLLGKTANIGAKPKSGLLTTSKTKTGSDFLAEMGLDPKSIDVKLKQIGQSFRGLGTTMQDVKQEMLDIGPLIAGAIIDIAEAIGDTLSGGREFGKDIIKAVGKFAQQLGALFIATGVAEAAFQSGNPYAMIAAGIALVALGTAVNSMMSKQSQGSHAMASNGSSGPGYRPSEMGTVKIEGKMRGYDMSLVEEREAYRRRRVG